MRCYIESSILAAALLERDPDAIQSLRDCTDPVTSALTLAEVRRAILRARISGRLSAAAERAILHELATFENGCAIVAVSAEVLKRAATPFPIEPIRTLDAIHLATAEMLGSEVVILSRDQRVRANAKMLGYVLG